MAQPEEMQDKIMQLNSLQIWTKISDGDLHLVTFKDVQELFHVMDDNKKGFVSGSDLMMLQAVAGVKLSEQDLRELVRDADKDGSGNISAEELYDAITKGAIAFNVVKENLRKKEVELKSHQCEREKLIEWMKWEYETSTALWSLPTVIGTCVTFALVASTHIDLFSAFRIHQGMEANFPSIINVVKYKVVDIRTTNIWTRQWYIPTIFRQDPAYDPVPGRVTAMNQMIFGARMSKFYRDPVPCPVNEVIRDVYNSRSGSCYYHGELKESSVVFPYHLAQPVLLDMFENMTQMPWLDEAVATMEYQILTYNANLNHFTLYIHQFINDLNPEIRHRFQHESFIAEPYLSGASFIPDVLLLLLCLRSVYLNLKELLPAVMAGLDGFLTYMTGWKVVEWTSIIFSMACFGFWMSINMELSVDLPRVIAAYPKGELDAAIREKGHYLSLDELEETVSMEDLVRLCGDVMRVGSKIRDEHELMRTMFAVNFIALIFRFFLSFQANPRLDIVVQTLVDCTPNVAHFFIVFSAIFTCYAFAGHFLFGGIMEGYSTVLASLFFCYRGSVGFDVLKEMPVGEQVLGYSWVLSYQLLVSSLILSMLIGIVFGSYYAVQGAAGQPQTLWEQVRKAIQTAAETRNFMSLWTLIVLLEDDDYPAHPQKTVTALSLKKAFEKEKMSRQNAEYLLRKTVEYAKDRLEQPVLDLPDAVKIIGNSFNVMQKNEETLEQSAILLQKSVGSDSLLVGMRKQERRARTQEPTAPKTSLEILEKGVENLDEMLADLKYSQERTIQIISTKLEEERHATLARHHRLQGLLEEFKGRLVRGQRGISRLKSFMGAADFASIQHIPEQMENDLMRCFGSRPALAREMLQPSQVNMLERQCREIQQQLQDVSEEFRSLTDCQPTLWDLTIKCRKLKALPEQRVSF